MGFGRDDYVERPELLRVANELRFADMQPARIVALLATRAVARQGDSNLIAEASM